MMLRKRATEPEQFDSPTCSPEAIAAGYRELARVNEVCRAHDPYTRLLWRWLGRENCRELSILDLGAGDAWIGRRMERFAREQGWHWRVTNLDVNAIGLALNGSSRNVAASVTALPFASGSFDVVIASQMTHHLDTEAAVVQHLREAWRVARRGIFITDMQRSLLLYGLVWLMVRALRLSRAMREDGELSVKRSFTPKEWRALAREAGLSGARVSSFFGMRVMLAAKKTAAIAAANETSVAYRGAGEFCSAPFGR